jgi:hypothetical protein
VSFLDRLHPSFRTPGEAEPNVAYFVARLGGVALDWAEEYTLTEHVELMGVADRSVRHLRARRIEAGKADLDVAESMLRETADRTRSVHLLLARWYYQASAYLSYRTEDYAGAEEALDRAEEMVSQAIGLDPFLLPYAMRCCELWSQRIRVTRTQRRWAELWRRVEVTRQIVEGERPCCLPAGGAAVHIAAVQAFYSRFDGLTERERTPLSRVLDDEARRRQFRAVLSEIYLLPGFVIPYVPSTSAARGAPAPAEG